MMRTILILALLATVPWARPAASQSILLQGSGGPTLIDAGSSVAAGIAVPMSPRIALAASVERTHLSSRTERHDNVISLFRGGTFLMASAELQVAPFAGQGVRPFALAGFAIGRSRPNVNHTFPDRVVNAARAVFVGGGLHVPLTPHLSAFADSRFMFGVEGDDGIVALAPVRGGLAWRF